MLGATDRAALTDLVHRYAAGVDDRQFDSVAELFTDKAELMLPEPPAKLDPVHRHCGRAAIRTAIAAVAATIRTEHAIVGEVFDAGPRPDSARGRIACVAHHWSHHGDQLTDVVWHLRYDDEYRRTDAGWRIAGRTLTINAIETRPVRRVRSEGPSGRGAGQP
jgi:3-phenylpropionate/cinnamic acid dioxygenase small subunit